MGDYFGEEMRNQKEELESISGERRLKNQMGIRDEPPEKISKLEGDQTGNEKGLGEALLLYYCCSRRTLWTFQFTGTCQGINTKHQG